MKAKRYLKLLANGMEWTESYDEASLLSLKEAGRAVLSWDQVACIIPDASGKWLVVWYDDPDLN